MRTGKTRLNTRSTQSVITYCTTWSLVGRSLGVASFGGRRGFGVASFGGCRSLGRCWSLRLSSLVVRGRGCLRRSRLGGRRARGSFRGLRLSRCGSWFGSSSLLGLSRRLCRCCYRTSLGLLLLGGPSNRLSTLALAVVLALRLRSGGGLVVLRRRCRGGFGGSLVALLILSSAERRTVRA